MIIWENNNNHLDELYHAANRLLGLAILKRGHESTRKERSFSHEFRVNQNGLLDRYLPKETKKEFKQEIMSRWHEKNFLTPQPFTGRIVVHVQDLQVREVHFIPNPGGSVAE